MKQTYGHDYFGLVSALGSVYINSGSTTAIRILIPHKKSRLNCCHILLLRLGYIISLSCIVSVIALKIKWLIYLDILKGDNGQPWTPISLWNAIKWQSYMDFLIVINVFVRIFKTWQRRNNSHAFDHRYMPLLCLIFFHRINAQCHMSDRLIFLIIRSLF